MLDNIDKQSIQQLASNQTAMMQAIQRLADAVASKSEKKDCCGSCKVGGPCEGGCDGQPTSTSTASTNPPCPSPIPLQFPECYGNCKPISACLRRYMDVARGLISDWQWSNYLQNESPIVHLNTQIGGAPNYQAVFPVGAGQNIVLMQEAAQVLPYEAGLLKVDANWNGTAAPTQVLVQLWIGPDSITSVTSTPQAAGLVQVGRQLTLADFECKDDCYLINFPDFFNCKSGAIPYRTRVFAEIRGQAGMGATTLTGLNFTIIKRYTQKYQQCCKQWNYVAPMD